MGAGQVAAEGGLGIGPGGHQPLPGAPLGAVTVTGALVLVVYAISQVPAAGWASARTLAMLAASAVLLAGVTDHDAGIASGLLNTSQQIGGTIGVAVALQRKPGAGPVGQTAPAAGRQALASTTRSP